MQQQKSMFAVWYRKVRYQAGICKWDNYNADSAAWDTILIQTRNTKLQEKIIAKDLKYEDVVKFDLVMEHSDIKVKEPGKNQGEEEEQVTPLESQVHK